MANKVFISCDEVDKGLFDDERSVIIHDPKYPNKPIEILAHKSLVRKDGNEHWLEVWVTGKNASGGLTLLFQMESHAVWLHDYPPTMTKQPEELQ